MDLVLSILRCALGMLAVTAASVHSAGRPNRDYSFFSAEHPLPIEGSKRCWRRGCFFMNDAVMRAGYGHGGLVRQASADVHARSCAASAKPPLHKLSSQRTPRWREMDSNFRFRAR